MKPGHLKPTERFAGRQQDYSMSRPSYPAELLKWLERNAQFSSKSIVADIGSGTGKLTALFLDNGNEVFAVEPNNDMRFEAERLLGKCARFRSVIGSAENTTLQSESVDLVSAGQAFHWFNRTRAKKEFLRILKRQGFVMLVWNTRKRERGTFSHDYEGLIEKHKSEKVGWSSSEGQVEQISKFFSKNNFSSARFDNLQFLDFEHLLGRIRSASYMPREGKNFDRIVNDAMKAFAEHQFRGRVTIEYVTEIYLGILD